MGIIILFVICVGACWLIATGIREMIFGKIEKEKYTFVDKSVHHHTHKHIHIIDEKTKKDIAEYHEKKQLEK